MSDILDGVVGLPGETSSGGEVNLPPAAVRLPALPVVDSEAAGTKAVEEALTVAVLTVALELEGEALQATIIPVTVALPVLATGLEGSY